MKKTLLIGAAAIAAVGIVPAVAHNAAAPARPAEDKVATRAEIQAKVAEHFARIDANRDGVVTKAEADAARTHMRGHMGERLQARHAKAFDRIDTNNDGSISRAEFETRRDERRAARGERGKRLHRMGGFARMHGQMFEMADANKDARVTLQEATAAALRHFDMADINRDGRITRDEKKQMRQHMRGQRHAG